MQTIHERFEVVPDPANAGCSELLAQAGKDRRAIQNGLTGEMIEADKRGAGVVRRQRETEDFAVECVESRCLQSRGEFGATGFARQPTGQIFDRMQHRHARLSGFEECRQLDPLGREQSHFVDELAEAALAKELDKLGDSVLTDSGTAPIEIER